MKKYMLRVIIGLVCFLAAMGVMASQGYLAGAYNSVSTMLTPAPAKHPNDKIMAFREFISAPSNSSLFEFWHRNNNDVRVDSKINPSTKEGFDTKTITYSFSNRFNQGKDFLTVHVCYNREGLNGKQQYEMSDNDLDGYIDLYKDKEILPELQNEFDQALDYLDQLMQTSQ